MQVDKAGKEEWKRPSAKTWKWLFQGSSSSSSLSFEVVNLTLCNRISGFALTHSRTPPTTHHLHHHLHPPFLCGSRWRFHLMASSARKVVKVGNSFPLSWADIFTWVKRVIGETSIKRRDRSAGKDWRAVGWQEAECLIDWSVNFFHGDIYGRGRGVACWLWFLAPQISFATID